MKIEIVILIASVVMIAAEVDFCQYNCDDNKNIGCDNEKVIFINKKILIFPIIRF